MHIAPSGLIGKDPTEQTKLDNFMLQQLDGTVNEWGWCKQKLGANVILAVSLAVCKVGASVNKIPLYKNPAELDDWLGDLNPESKVAMPCAYAVPTLRPAAVGDSF